MFPASFALGSVCREITEIVDLLGAGDSGPIGNIRIVAVVLTTVWLVLSSAALLMAAHPPQAFLIAFTSDFLPRLLYQYEYDSHLHGYVNFTLAYSPRSNLDGNHTMCR